MSGDTFRYLNNKIIAFISWLSQTADIASVRRMVESIRWVGAGKHAQSRADKDRNDSLKILEDRLEKKDITKEEFEIMKYMLTGKKPIHYKSHRMIN